MTSPIVVGLFLILGTAFCLLAALGLVRMPDFYCRLQATTKATTLGTGFVMIAVALYFGEGPPVTRALAVVLFLLVTNPVSGHMLSRAAYMLGVPLSSRTLSDAMTKHIQSNSLNPEEDIPDVQSKDV